MCGQIDKYRMSQYPANYQRCSASTRKMHTLSCVDGRAKNGKILINSHGNDAIPFHRPIDIELQVEENGFFRRYYKMPAQGGALYRYLSVIDNKFVMDG